MRRAEMSTAVVLGLFSLYLMWKSAELPIGWVRDKGPAGGAFPFWLSLVMLVSSAWIFLRGLWRQTPESRNPEPFMDRTAVRLFAVTAGGLLGILLIVTWLGFYVAIPVLFVYYVRIVGRHSWVTTLALAILSPIATFFFFEIGLRILLPKGITEPLFYPLYAIFF